MASSLGEGQIAEFIEHDEVETGEIVGDTALFAVAVLGLEPVDETDSYTQWSEVPSNEVYDNAFRLQWEDFLRHVVADSHWTYTLLEGAKGVQLGELALQSSAERRWIEVRDLTLA